MSEAFFPQCIAGAAHRKRGGIALSADVRKNHGLRKVVSLRQLLHDKLCALPVGQVPDALDAVFQPGGTPGVFQHVRVMVGLDDHDVRSGKLPKEVFLDEPKVRRQSDHAPVRTCACSDLVAIAASRSVMRNGKGRYPEVPDVRAWSAQGD